MRLRWAVPFWTACAVTGAALWYLPAFARVWEAELFPIGVVTGWLAHGGIRGRRDRD